MCSTPRALLTYSSGRGGSVLLQARQLVRLVLALLPGPLRARTVAQGLAALVPEEQDVALVLDERALCEGPPDRVERRLRVVAIWSVRSRLKENREDGRRMGWDGGKGGD